MASDNTKLENPRLAQLPILHARGTHRVVGFTIGRTFKNLIQDVYSKCGEDFAPVYQAYKTREGKSIYENALKLCRKRFPGYVEELEGMSEGSGVPFHEIFLPHIDANLVPSEMPKSPEIEKAKGSVGCSAVMSYLGTDKIYLAHNEDAYTFEMNNGYLLHAEILNDEGKTIEKFSSFCWAGFLPCGTMGYNHHGVFHSVNSLSPGQTYSDKTPMLFQLRSLLKASSVDEIIDIVKDKGCGASEGFSVNVVYAPNKTRQAPIVANIEVGPNPDRNVLESEVSVYYVPLGESYSHCNKILRLSLLESNMERMASSINRHKAIDKYAKPYDFDCIKNIMSDQSIPEFPVFRDDMSKNAVTLVTGIFDIGKRNWSIFTHQASKSDPIAEIQLKF